jgi:hypothetical protein
MRYVNLKSFNFGWAQIATNPYRTGATQSSTQAIAVIINGCYGLLHITSVGNPGVSHGAYLMLVNKAGQLCTYATPDFFNGSANNVLMAQPYNVQISGNSIQWFLNNNPVTYKWVIPNVFEAGVNYVVPYSTFTPINPCGEGLFSTAIFMGQQGLVAYEFIQTLGGSTAAYYASIYNSQNNYLAGGLISVSGAGTIDTTPWRSTLGCIHT